MTAHASRRCHSDEQLYAAGAAGAARQQPMTPASAGRLVSHIVTAVAYLSEADAAEEKQPAA